MATDASSGLGFVRHWANAPGLDLLQLLRTYDARWARKPDRAHENEAILETAETEDIPEKGGLVPNTSPEKLAVEENGLQASAEGVVEQTYHILLLGIGDIHHILTSCAASTAKMHFYLVEEREEILARHILLFDILNDQTLSLPERIETFLDVYGNCFLLAKTATYMEQRLFPHLINFVCRESSHLLDELVDLSQLKHREKDEIQDVMETWRGKVLFDMISLRDQRLRHCYAQRFDYKVNMMDWNYQMNLTHSMKRCQNVRVRGFWGDIVSGPFYAYGVTTCKHYRERLFRKVNNQHRYNTQDIADFNLSRILYKLEEGEELTLPPASKEDDMYPLPSPAELLFRRCASSSTCGSSAARSADASAVAEENQKGYDSTVAEEKRKVCNTSTIAVENTDSPVKDGTEKTRLLPPPARSNRNSSSDFRQSEECRIERVEEAETSSTQSARHAEKEQQACSKTEMVPSRENVTCGDSASSQATAPLQSDLTGLLKGFRSTKITLLKGDAAEVLRRRRYTGLFDMVMIANVSTTTFLKACNLLDSAERTHSAIQKRNEESPNSPNSDGQPESSVDTVKRETPQAEVAALKEDITTYMNKSRTQEAKDGRMPIPPENCLSACMKPDALLCVETLKYSAALDSIAKIRFRQLVARSAQVLNWTLCNASSLPPMASQMMDREGKDTEENDKEDNRAYSSVVATREEAAADDYMIFRLKSSSCSSASADSDAVV